MLMGRRLHNAPQQGSFAAIVASFLIGLDRAVLEGNGVTGHGQTNILGDLTSQGLQSNLITNVRSGSPLRVGRENVIL